MFSASATMPATAAPHPAHTGWQLVCFTRRRAWDSLQEAGVANAFPKLPCRVFPTHSTHSSGPFSHPPVHTAPLHPHTDPCWVPFPCFTHTKCPLHTHTNSTHKHPCLAPPTCARCSPARSAPYFWLSLCLPNSSDSPVALPPSAAALLATRSATSSAKSVSPAPDSPALFLKGEEEGGREQQQQQFVLCWLKVS